MLQYEPFGLNMEYIFFMPESWWRHSLLDLALNAVDYNALCVQIFTFIAFVFVYLCQINLLHSCTFVRVVFVDRYNTSYLISKCRKYNGLCVILFRWDVLKHKTSKS